MRLNKLKSISIPLKNSKKITPTFCKISSVGEAAIQLKREGPKITPMIISTTAVGKKVILNLAIANGTNNAASRIITKDN